jgi:hypothetical protein
MACGSGETKLLTQGTYQEMVCVPIFIDFPPVLFIPKRFNRLV